MTLSLGPGAIQHGAFARFSATHVALDREQREAHAQDVDTWYSRPMGPIAGAEVLCRCCQNLLALGWKPGTTSAVNALGLRLTCGLCRTVTDIREVCLARRSGTISGV